MSADVTNYLNLITSEHRVRPNFVSVIATLLQPAADTTAVLLGLPSQFDLDNAVGDQLDKGGEWIGQNRLLDPTTAAMAGENQIDDFHYRPLLKGLAALNSQWDGTTPLAYQAYGTWFAVNYPGAGGVIEDTSDLSIVIGQYGATMDQVDTALFLNGYLTTRIAGVRIRHYVAATAAAPLFGLGVNGDGVAGLGIGCWGTFDPPS